MPTTRAGRWALRFPCCPPCIAPSCACSRVRLIRSMTYLSPISRDRPGRVASYNSSIPYPAKPRLHLSTVIAATPTRSATTLPRSQSANAGVLEHARNPHPRSCQTEHHLGVRFPTPRTTADALLPTGTCFEFSTTCQMVNGSPSRICLLHSELQRTLRNSLISPRTKPEVVLIRIKSHCRHSPHSTSP